MVLFVIYSTEDADSIVLNQTPSKANKSYYQPWSNQSYTVSIGYYRDNYSAITSTNMCRRMLRLKCEMHIKVKHRFVGGIFILIIMRESVHSFSHSFIFFIYFYNTGRKIIRYIFHIFNNFEFI
jgi:hypothetical protein